MLNSTAQKKEETTELGEELLAAPKLSCLFALTKMLTRKIQHNYFFLHESWPFFPPNFALVSIKQVYMLEGLVL